MTTKAEIIKGMVSKGMARAFFACAWADQCEEAGQAAMISGREIMDMLPAETDSAAIHAARTLYMDMERANGKETAAIYWNNTGGLEPEKWGHYAAMQAMGHGVGLREYVEGVKVPYVEFGAYSLERDYFA